MERNRLLEQVVSSTSELPNQANVSRLTPEELASLAEACGIRTAFGSVNFVSTVKNRSAALTVAFGGGTNRGFATQKRRDIARGAPETLRVCRDYLKKAPLVQVDFTLGGNPLYAPACRLYASTYRREMVRLAHKTLQSFFPSPSHDQPALTVVLIPEWQEKDRQILVFPEIGVTYILGTDYYGEVKHAFLRMAMWNARQRDMLGLHAAAQLVEARGADERLRRVGLMILGIAGTGKTTHACDDHGLNLPGESVKMVQDEVVFWRRDGAALGSERGFYVKTEGISPQTHPVLYQAATSPRAVLDNVLVDYEGRVFFDDRSLTANARAIIQKDDLGPLAADSCDLPPLAELDGILITFLTRSQTVMPVASRLTPEQAAVAFVLGESIDVSGADAKIAIGPGKEVITNPFLVGDPAEEANLFYEMLKGHGDRIECYLLNTGGVGELVEIGLDGSRRVVQRSTRIQLAEMAAVIRGIARGTIRWREDANWMVQTPEQVEGLDTARFDLASQYDQAKIDSLIAAVRLQRTSYIQQIGGLHPAIRQAVEF